MKVRSLNYSAIGALIAFIGTPSFAQEAKEAQEAKTPKFGFEYRFELAQSDDGLADEDKTAHLGMGIKRLKISLSGKAADNVDYFFRVAGDNGGIDYAWLNWNVTDMFSVLAGRAKVRMYGWDFKEADAFDIFDTIITDQGHAVTGIGVDEMVQLQADLAGKLTLQFAQDHNDCVSTTSGPNCSASWNTVKAGASEPSLKQPAFFLSWIGSFGPISPLVQYGSYDLGHSMTYTVGARFENDMVDVKLDYIVDESSAKGVDANDPKKSEDQKSTETGIVLSGEVHAGDWAPFFEYSTYNNKQYTPDGVEEPKVNQRGMWDDNGSTIGIGVFADHWGKGFRPYLAFQMMSGKFVDDKDAAKEETLSETEIKLGVAGIF